MLPIPLFPILYAQDVSGIPTDVLLTDLRGRITSYEHTIAAIGGFESATITLTVADRERAGWWLKQLMAGLVVYDWDGAIAWEGYLAGADVAIGTEQRSISLDGVANRIKARYTTATGIAGVTANQTDALSQSMYGTKDMVLSLGTATGTTATAAAAAAVRQYCQPRAAGSTQFAAHSPPGDAGGIVVTLHFRGWYSTLGWVLTSRTDKSSEITSAQVATLIGGGIGIAGINPFVNPNTSGILTTTTTDTRRIEPDTSYQAKIEALLGRGESNKRLVWGVYEHRKFISTYWAASDYDGSSSVANNYRIVVRRALANARLQAVFGGTSSAFLATDQPVEGIWPLWMMRPNTVWEVPDMADLNASGLAAYGPDQPGRMAVERVTFRAGGDGMSIDLEPSQSTNLDAVLSRFQ
jgi:hypothetical protein